MTDATKAACVECVVVNFVPAQPLMQRKVRDGDVWRAVVNQHVETPHVA